MNTDLSWREIARRIGVAKSTVSDYLREIMKRGRGDDTPKVLIYDIEFMPANVLTWGRFKQYIADEFVIHDPYMFSWVAKWLGGDEIIQDCISNYPSDYAEDPRNDINITKSLWQMFDMADIIVAHNNDNYDEKQLNTRAVRHGLIPPSPTKRVDTLKIAKAKFKFPRNSLSELARFLDVTRKLDNDGASLWMACYNGDESAICDMMGYNVGDVQTLEEVYLKLRPWDDRHPNMSLYHRNDELVCPRCGAEDSLVLSDKFAHTSVSKFNTFRCEDCSAIVRSRRSVKTKEQKENILTNISK
jgi:hypothetical protein